MNNISIARWLLFEKQNKEIIQWKLQPLTRTPVDKIWIWFKWYLYWFTKLEFPATKEINPLNSLHTN